ncbi:MAG: GNAT family N-acetyltransferase [Rhodobiaceae bacterium]|nr:GNAT family N-acetyltransferase [Rhodobiaceae bacterium]
MSKILVRPAEPADRNTLVVFMSGMLAAAGEIEQNRAKPDDAAAPHTDDLLKDIVTQDGAVFVAEVAGTAVGFIACTLSEESGAYIREEERRFGQVNNLFVVEGERGRGVAEALMVAAQDHIQARGVTHMRLSVLQGNGRARAFYERCGWTPYEISYRLSI